VFAVSAVRDSQPAARALAASAAAIGGLIAIRFALPAGTPRIRLRGKADPARSIAALEKVRIGGSDQWVLERSEDVGNPIVLYLHGGPGTSQLTSNRRNTRYLEKFFTVVNWDQRGAGKSYGAISDAGKMNIDQFVQDTRELTLYLLKKFGKERLVLAGHSWGSVIGALTVSRYPELYYCYVGIGQVANMREGEAASYQWTLDQARQHGDRRAAEALMRIGPPPYEGNWQRKTVSQRRYLARFGGEVHASRTGALGPIIASLLFSREYNLADRFNFFRGISDSMRLLWPELLEVDLFKSATDIRVPVLLMEGRNDWEVPSGIAEKYFDSIRAPSKQLIWFDRSAHMPYSEERDLFNRAMVAKVLPFATGLPRHSKTLTSLARTRPRYDRAIATGTYAPLTGDIRGQALRVRNRWAPTPRSTAA
jgi:pimeloyl-ACP methyl ester carboxylesterase